MLLLYLVEKSNLFYAGEKHLLMELAKHPGEFVSIDDLAQELGTSRHYITQLAYSSRLAYSPRIIQTRRQRGGASYRVDPGLLAP